jgi:hypothetical protein
MERRPLWLRKKEGARVRIDGKRPRTRHVLCKTRRRRAMSAVGLADVVALADARRGARHRDAGMRDKMAGELKRRRVIVRPPDFWDS